MKAIFFTEYGSPDVLQLQDIEKPSPQENEVLVKVYAASANPLDWHLMRGEPFLARLENGLRKPKHQMLGADIAGQVVAVGKNVKQFQLGDEVFGCLFNSGLGGFAEYVCAPENALVMKPPNLSFEQATAVPLAALTALQGQRNAYDLQPGQKVLVNGASGGVGSFAVQIAKSFGAEVTGVCSTRNLDMVRSLGADFVIDYTQEDFTKNGQQYDLILDAVGNRSVSEYKRALAPNGNCAIIGFSSLTRLFQHMIQGAWVSRKGGKEIGMMKTVHMDKDDLLFIYGLLETGKVIPVIDRCYPLNETADAIRYLEKGHARGKVIVTIEQNNKSWQSRENE